jgi:DNA recombination protein RmuC
VLGAVKAEFGRFGSHLQKVRTQLETASGTLEKLQTTRTNVLERKLRNVDALDPLESRDILELPAEEGEDEPNEA